jgi:hypothetical protein
MTSRQVGPVCGFYKAMQFMSFHFRLIGGVRMDELILSQLSLVAASEDLLSVFISHRFESEPERCHLLGVVH